MQMEEKTNTGQEKTIVNWNASTASHGDGVCPGPGTISQWEGRSSTGQSSDFLGTSINLGFHVKSPLFKRWQLH